MKKTTETEIEKSFKDLPDDLAEVFISLFDEKNFKAKMEARDTLVNAGAPILFQLHKLLTSDSDIIRLEIVKIVELIGDKKSIPVLINLLDDTEFDIRWIAAGGLIKIGRRSIVPLLKSIRNGKSLFFPDKGAHRVFQVLLTGQEKEQMQPLLLSLDNYHELAEIAPVQASAALKTIFHCK